MADQEHGAVHERIPPAHLPCFATAEIVRLVGLKAVQYNEQFAVVLSDVVLPVNSTTNTDPVRVGVQVIVKSPSFRAPDGPPTEAYTLRGAVSGTSLGQFFKLGKKLLVKVVNVEWDLGNLYAHLWSRG